MPEQIEDLVAAIHALTDECQKVEELQRQEEIYSNDVVGQLKKMMAPLDGPLRIDPDMLKGRFSTLEDSELSECSLSNKGVVSFSYRSGKIIRLPLEDVPEYTAFSIISEAVPEIKNAFLKQREKLGTRSSAITKIEMELRKILVSKIHKDDAR